MVVNGDDCLCILLCLALMVVWRRFSPPPKPKTPEDNIPSNGPKGSGEVYIERSECMYRLEIWF